MRIGLRCREDWRTIAFVALSLGLLVLPYGIHPAFPASLAWIALTALMCFVSSIAAHNHLHSATFATSLLNLGMNFALSLARGHTASGIIVPHNLNHHVDALTEQDWIRPALAGTGPGWLRLIRYVLAASANMVVERRRAVHLQLTTRQARIWHAERMALAGFIMSGLIIDWHVFLVFDVIPWLLGLCLLVGVNLLQHDGCSAAEPLRESRNFVGRAGNWLFLNNGFHAAHHHDPGCHWSRLPDLHARLRQQAPLAMTDHHSILRYLWTFAWTNAPAIAE
jgi:beta-carotene hydroxylase